MAASASVTRIAGIGRTFASRLKAHGIETAAHLRERLASLESRRLFAWESGISVRRLETWCRLAAAIEEEEKKKSSAAESADPLGPRIPPSDGLSTAESAELSEGLSAAADADAAVREPALVIDDAAPGVDEIDPAPAFIDSTSLLRSIGRLRTVALGVLAIALLALASAITVRHFAAPGRPGEKLLNAGLSPLSHVERGSALLREGKAAEAEAEFRLALAIDPRTVEARVELGRALLRQRRLADAVAELRAAIEMRTDVAAAHYYLSSALLAQNDPAAALAAARRAASLDPTFPWSYYNMALAWDEIEDAPPLSPTEHRAAVRALVADIETAEGTGLAQTARLLSRLAGGPPAAGLPRGDERDPLKEDETLRAAWRRWAEGAGLGSGGGAATGGPDDRPPVPGAAR